MIFSIRSMSDLDYEDEINENEAITECTVEQTPSVKSLQDHPNNAKCSEIPEDVRGNSEEGEIQSDTGEIQSDAGEVSKSDCNLTDLEEGEINDENTDGNNFVVCRFFQNGNCRFGKQCRFVHVGASAYKMFDSRVFAKNFHSAIPHPYVYYSQSKPSSPPVCSERNGDAWEQGLEEAKKLLSMSRDKKETDVEFEDKKLYLQTEKETVDRKTSTRERDLRHKKREKHCKPKTKFKPSPSEYSEKETKVKKRKNHSKPYRSSPEIWTDPWRRSRSRTRNPSRSSSSSSLSSQHWTQKSSCSSLCSLCSSDDKERHSDSKIRASKPESKLQRVFSRTFSRSRSRERSLSRSRSKSCSASLRRSLYRSYSRSRSSSSSASWCSKKSSIQKAFAKSISNKLSSNASKGPRSPKQHKRKLSPETHSSNRWLKDTVNSDWDSSSSDLTVSSITCTTFSGSRSSVDSGSAKRTKVTTDTNTCSKKSVHPDEKLLQSYKKNALERDSTYKKCENEKRPTVTTNLKSHDKVILDDPKETTGRKSYPDKYSPDSNKKRNNSEVPLVKKPEKQTISGLELLKYLPTKNRHLAAERKETSAKSTETVTEPKKVISISLKPKTKLVPTKSVLSSPVRKSLEEVVDKPLTRREQLLRQLEAVELAIAKRKKIS